MRIETLKSRDAAAFSKSIKAVIDATRYYSRAAQNAEMRKYSPAKVFSLLSDSTQILLVAKDGKEIVGFLHGHFDAGTFWVDWIGVSEKYRRSHTASELLSFLENKIRRTAHKIWLDTRTENKEAVRFFKKNGFKKIATLSDHWYRQDFFLWEKFL